MNHTSQLEDRSVRTVKEVKRQCPRELINEVLNLVQTVFPVRTVWQLFKQERGVGTTRNQFHYSRACPPKIRAPGEQRACYYIYSLWMFFVISIQPHYCRLGSCQI
jgi:hypothetical protein